MVGFNHLVGYVGAAAKVHGNATQRGEMWHLKVRFPYIHEVLNGLDFVANLHTFELLAAYLVATKKTKEKSQRQLQCVTKIKTWTSTRRNSQRKAQNIISPV